MLIRPKKKPMEGLKDSELTNTALHKHVEL